MFIPKIILCALMLCCIENVYGKTTPATKDAIETHPNVNLLPQSCGYINGRRIFDGGVAKLHEFPWMAFIYSEGDNDKDLICGGTIINSKYILTAAHCVSGQNEKKVAGVRIGEFDLRSKVDCQGGEPQLVCESHLQDIQVENIILHQNYSIPTSRNDIALIRLKKPIDFQYKNALPICLPVTQENRNIRLAGTIATVTGWGLTESGLYSDVLLKVKILIRSEEECANYIKKGSAEEFILKEICSFDNGKDSCKGDSGGPLMVEGEYDEDIRYIQYGIVSYGIGECGVTAGIYIDVTKYMGWILDNIRE